jgi:hypothetical protein
MSPAADKLIEELEAFKRASLTHSIHDDVVVEEAIGPDIDSFRMLDLSHPVELRAVVLTAREKGLQRFDPVRFHFIESLLSRASNQCKADVVQALEAKARQALEGYVSSFLLAYDRAKTALEGVISTFPDSATELKELLGQLDIKGYERAVSKRKNRKARPLAELLRLMSNAVDQDPSGNRMLDDNWLTDTIPGDSSPTASALSSISSPVKHELKSVRAFKVSSQKREVDSRVSQAIDESPENAGPLNPQRLMVRSLSTLRDLSPTYLGRFVSMIDAMLWLESADQSIDTSESAKANIKSKSVPALRTKASK